MNPRDITPEDLALYAMNLLDGEERRAVEQFLATTSEARVELGRITADLALLALSAEQVAPPALSKQRLLKQAMREKKAVPFAGYEETSLNAPSAQLQRTESLSTRRRAVPQRDEFEDEEESGDLKTAPSEFRFGGFNGSSSEEDEGQEERPRNIVTLAFPWVGWAVAAGLSFTALNIMRDRDSLRNRVRVQSTALSTANESAERAQLVLDTLASSSAQRFTLTKTDVRPPATGRVVYLADRGSLIFQGNNLEALPADKTYELWLIPNTEGRQPVPAGTFRPDAAGYATLILPEMPKGLTASKFGVTIEDNGGALAPTLPIVMIGQ